MNDDPFSPTFGTQLDGNTSTPTSSSSFSHPSLTYFPQNVLATPSYTDNGADIARMKLADLLVNQHVEILFNKWTEANNKAERYIEEQHRLLQQVSTLQNMVFMLRTELAAVQTKG
jgi:hypothetical protein